MTTIMCLSDDVIRIILSYIDISMEDIIQFKRTCQKFYCATKSTTIWMKKSLERWPSVKKIYEATMKYKGNWQKKNAFISEMMLRIIWHEPCNLTNTRKNEEMFLTIGNECLKYISRFISALINKHYTINNSIDNLISFNELFTLKCTNKIDFVFFDPLICAFYINELENQLISPTRKTTDNLTKTYCITKTYRYLRQKRQMQKWETFKRNIYISQLMERTATIVTQWLQSEKNVYYSYVKASLNTIKQEVLNHLKKTNPDHSIFRMPDESFSYWENNNIKDNQWNKAEGIQIMDALDEYLFGELKFQPKKNKELKYSCIDNVLENKCGHEIILLTIYHSVARRLGLRCDIKENNGSTYIFWKPTYATNSLENVRCFKICADKFPNCLIKQTNPEEFSAYNTIYAEKLLLEILKKFEDPPYYNNKFVFPPIEVQQYRKRPLFFFLKRDRNSTVNPEIKGQINRIPKFGVGMIVTHDKCQNECNDTINKRKHKNSIGGVIIAWYIGNKHKVIFTESEIWQSHMRFNTCCDFGDPDDLIHYLLLTEKNEICCVNEGALTLTSGWIDNSEIGRYFCKFEDTHYVPNRMMAKLIRTMPL